MRGGVRAAQPPRRGVPRGVLGLRVLVHLVPLPLLLPRVLALRVLRAAGPGVPLDLFPWKMKTLAENFLRNQQDFYFVIYYFIFHNIHHLRHRREDS